VPLPDASEPVTRLVHVSPDESLTVIVIESFVAPDPFEATEATSSDPGGGVKAAVVTVVALPELTGAGLDESSASVPLPFRISSSAITSVPDASEGADAPSVTGVPAVVVPDDRNVPTAIAYDETATFWVNVVPEAAVNVALLATFTTAPYTSEPLPDGVMGSSGTVTDEEAADAPAGLAACPVTTLTVRAMPFSVAPAPDWAAVTERAISSPGRPS
jgi:hypothetical protein